MSGKMFIYNVGYKGKEVPTHKREIAYHLKLTEVSSGCLAFGGCYIHHHKSGEMISPEKEDLVLIENPTPEQKQTCQQKGCLLVDLKGVDYIEAKTKHQFGSLVVVGFEIVSISAKVPSTEPVKPIIQEPQQVKPVVADIQVKGEPNAVVGMQEQNKGNP